MIKIRDLEYLSALDEHKHFGRAAEACHVTQPTLSGQLMKLEEQLDVVLIERHRKQVMLTAAGEALLAKARIVLRAAEDLEQTARTLGDPLAGEFHLGLIPTLAPYLLPHIMSALHQELPKINFFLHEYQTADLLQQLDQGRLDALILPWLDEMQHMEVFDLFHEAFMLAAPASHPLAAKKRTELTQLKGYKVLTLEDGHCLRDQALGYCFSAGADEDKSFQATSLETLRYMVASGLGITLLPRLSVIDQKENPDIVYVPFRKPEPSRRIVLLVRHNYTRMDCVRIMVSLIRKLMKSV